MAIYQDAAYVKRGTGGFDAKYKPGDPTPHSGIYRCAVCGREDVSEAGKPLPSQNHNQHDPAEGPIRWKLLVYSEGDSIRRSRTGLKQGTAHSVI